MAAASGRLACCCVPPNWGGPGRKHQPLAGRAQPQAPLTGLQINDASDNFQLQATNVTNVSSARTYSWINTGTRASINHSTTTTAGSTLVVIKDAAGNTVYSKALSPSLNEPTAVGQPGIWSIQLTLSSYAGTLNFRAQKL